MERTKVAVGGAAASPDAVAVACAKMHLAALKSTGGLTLAEVSKCNLADLESVASLFSNDEQRLFYRVYAATMKRDGPPTRWRS